MTLIPTARRCDNSFLPRLSRWCVRPDSRRLPPTLATAVLCVVRCCALRHHLKTRCVIDCCHLVHPVCSCLHAIRSLSQIVFSSLGDIRTRDATTGDVTRLSYSQYDESCQNWPKLTFKRPATAKFRRNLRNRYDI